MARKASARPALDEHSPVPLRSQLAGIIRDAISRGEYVPGQRLPTVREMAGIHAVGKTTAAGAIDELVGEGLLVARPHRGTFVAGDPDGETRRRILTGQIGLYLGGTDDLAHDPFYVSILSSIQQAAALAGNAVALLHEGERSSGRAPFLRLVAECRLDGVIYVATRRIDGEIVEAVRRARIPLVTVDYAPRRLQFDTIMIDNTRGAEQAMRRLVSLGHRRIAYIGSPGRPLSASAAERRDAYRSVLRESGIGYDPSLARADQVSVAGGARAMRALLAARPTAVFTFTDYHALGAIQAAEAAGLDVPRDLSVVGFGDLLSPLGLDRPVSTVVVDTARMGRSAMEHLARRIDGHSGAPEVVRVPSKYVDRATTARAPRSGRG